MGASKGAAPRDGAERERGAATIETVAARAGVSRQTVSNVLRAPERVKPATRARVQHAIDELGYRPNRSASSLRSSSTRMLGYRCHPFDDDGNLLLDRFLHDLCRAAAKREYHIVLISPVGVDDELATYDDMLRSRTVDGYILSETYRNDDRLATLIERGTPFVSFGRNWDQPEANVWVDVDGGAGTADATEYFWRAGHRNIAYIGWGDDSPVGEDRLDGYRRTIARLGGRPMQAACLDTVEAGEAATTRLLGQRAAPTAFVCSSDVLAVGVSRACVARDLRIGIDVGIIGFDDTRTAQAATPQLSSIRQPTDRAATELIERIDALLNGRTLPSLMLRPTLIHRGSS
jgi:DNA-binding LacI/PurR family transcriptional regulator